MTIMRSLSPESPSTTSPHPSNMDDEPTQQPRDAKLITALLRGMGVEEFDPKVVHQLLEFTHRMSILFSNIYIINIYICLFSCFYSVLFFSI